MFFLAWSREGANVSWVELTLLDRSITVVSQVFEPSFLFIIAQLSCPLHFYNFWTLSGCPTIQFWHSTILSWHKSPQVKKQGAQQDYPCFSHQLQVGSPDYPHFFLADYKFGASHNRLKFSNLLEWLTELRKVLYYDYTNEQRDEAHRARSEKVLSSGAYVLMESGCIMFVAQGYRYVHQPGSSPELWYPEFLYGTLSCRHAWLNNSPHDWTQSLGTPYSPEVLG